MELPYSNKSLYTALSELEIIDTQALKECFEQSNAAHTSAEEVLLQKGLINEETLGKIIGDLLSKPYVNLSEVAIEDAVLKIIPELVAESQETIAFRVDEKGLAIATSNPKNTQFFSLLSIKTGLPLQVYYSTKAGIRKALSLYTKDVTTAFDEIIARNVAEVKNNKNAEPPIIKIVDTILDYADESGASDVHIEPLEEITLVRFRIDGVLHDVIKLPLDLDPQIVTRIKVMANLRTDEHQRAQDGKIVYKKGNGDLDIRVSIAPITRGEKIVMRLLSESSRSFSLSDLGFSPADLKKVERAYLEPHGMILSTGPTGSGKTTSLYSILKLLNKRDINIMTIEDPVEYQMDNVNQMQVNPKAELTFAKGLRSIVRQDPDIILIGEIRDEETADIAVNSAMTGHLVLSTLHTNDAATTFPRLVDMNVEPYLIASTITVIIGQRLARKICTKCKISETIPFDTLEQQIQKYVPKNTDFVCYKGKGCPICHNTGFMGRIAIFEVLEVTDEIRTAVTERKNASEIQKLAMKLGMTTMLQDGVEKVKQGITSIDELLRVIKE